MKRHVGVQNNGKMSLRFCIIIESNSQDFFRYCSVHQYGRRDVTLKPRELKKRWQRQRNKSNVIGRMRKNNRAARAARPLVQFLA